MRLTGHLRTADGGALLAALREATVGVKVLQIDFGGVDRIDGGIIALLWTDLAGRGVRADLLGGERFRPLIELYAEGVMAPPRQGPSEESAMAKVGRAAVQKLAAVRDSLGFLGGTVVAASRSVRRVRRRHGGEIASSDGEYQVRYYRGRRWTLRPETYVRRSLTRALFEKGGFHRAIGTVSQPVVGETFDGFVAAMASALEESADEIAGRIGTLRGLASGPNAQ